MTTKQARTLAESAMLGPLPAWLVGDVNAPRWEYDGETFRPVADPPILAAIKAAGETC